MDFIDKLPPSMGCTSMLVLTDRLGKGVIFEPFDKMDAETLARKFIKIFYAHHGLPAAIVSDRGTQFVSEFWERICKLLKIKRRLSTAYHPETDGSTEKMNATLETYLRMFVDWAQDDWAFLAPAAMLAINNRDAASTGVSPFFLDHGYNMEPLDLLEEPRGNENGKTSRQRADAIVTKLKGALELAQAAMATAQQIQEDATNRHREPAVEHQVGDKVWLDMRHIRTDRPSKKLDNRNAKYTVIEKIGSHAYRLDTPAGIHNVFSTHLLRPAADDPFPSQKLTDYQPPAVLIDGHKEWIVEKIVGERRKRIGRGYRHEFHIKWEGYSRLTWEPAYNFTESAALDEWEAQQGTPRTAGALTVYHTPTRKGRRGGGGGYCHGRSPELS
jgi:hypothetical protein